jgi:hypothetical protein
MTRKLIHDSFEIDLSIKRLSMVRENHCFADSFFVKQSFPFDLELTDELDAALGFISRHNSTQKKTYILCKYYHNDTIEDAILEIESFQDKLSCLVGVGYDQLPNWDKKLSELDLESFELEEGTDIYEHAETIIPQTWPDVNYNFPQIHTDKIDPESDDVWVDFEKIINNRVDGAFLINEVVEDVTYNRNIMQPLPYWLYVLQVGFQDAGYTLVGDILNDQRLQKKTIYGDVDYYTTVTQDSISIIKLSEDRTETGTIQANPPLGAVETYFRYEHTETIANPGRYRLIGKVKRFLIPGITSWIRIKYRDQIIWQNQGSQGIYVVKKNVDVVFDTLADLEPDEIIIESYQGPSNGQVVFELDINPIRLHDAEGNPIPNIINQNQVDLKKSVPDMTFGEFVTQNKNWYNYDLSIVGNQAVMNKVETQINHENAIDLTHTEVKFPLIEHPKGDSFLLKFADVETKDYTFLPVFQNLDGVVNSGYTTNDKTIPIEINALPLPLLVRNGVQTAHAFESNSNKLYAVLYDGLTDGKNLAKDPFPISIPEVHETNHKKWMDARINGEEYTWNFSEFSEKLLELRPNRKIYGYGKFHVIRTINDTETSPGVFDIEIETLSLE